MLHQGRLVANRGRRADTNLVERLHERVEVFVVNSRLTCQSTISECTAARRCGHTSEVVFDSDYEATRL